MLFMTFMTFMVEILFASKPGLLHKPEASELRDQNPTFPSVFSVVTRATTMPLGALPGANLLKMLPNRFWFQTRDLGSRRLSGYTKDIE
jgi:hypothetical protein